MLTHKMLAELNPVKKPIVRFLTTVCELKMKVITVSYDIWTKAVQVEMFFQMIPTF